jgi:hypothetical protein
MMLKNTTIALLAALIGGLFVGEAHAQSFTGTIASGFIYGNGTASAAKPAGTSLGTVFDRAFSASNGNLLQRNSGVWGATSNLILTTSSANALVVGPAGTTNPVLKIDASTASQAAGLNILGGSAGGGVAVSILDTATNSPLALNAKGNSGVFLGNTSTGTVNIGGGGGGATVTNSFTATGLVTYGDMATAALATTANYTAAAANTLVPTSIIYTAETTTTYGTTTAFDFSTFINTAVTLTGNITTMNTSNIKAGQAGMITFIQDSSGSHTTVWNSNFKFAGGVTPTLSTAPNAVDVLFYSCRSATFCPASLNKAFQ